MPAKTAYTEAELKAYAHAALGGLSASLGWSVGAGSYDQLIGDALIEYGVTSVDDISGVKQVRLLLACVRYALWTQVANVTVGNFALSDSGTSLSLNQINQQARAAADIAQKEVTRFRDDLERSLNGSGIRIYNVVRTDDPYEAAVNCDDEFSQ